MAEILHGSSATLRHAPLSQEQTLGVCKHLQGLIEDCQRQIKDLFDSRLKMNDHLESTREDIRRVRATVVDIKEQTDQQHRDLQVIQKALAENSEGDKKVQEVLTQTCESVNKIRGGQETTNGNVHSLKEDLDKHTEALKDIQKVMGKVGDDGMVGQLLKGQQSLELRVDRLREEAKLLHGDMTKNRSDIKQLDEAARDARRSMHDFGTKLKEQAAERTELQGRLAGQKENLELTNAVVMRLHEGMESTRANLGQHQEEAYALDVRFGRLQEDFAKTAKSLSCSQSEITGLHTHVGTLQKQRGELSSDLLALKDAEDRTSAGLQALAQHVQRVQALAVALQQDLRRTNSLVLPNLAAEAGVSSLALKSSSIGEPPRSASMSL